MRKELYFCDKCGKEIKVYHNGDDTKNLYTFVISNNRKHHDMDNNGIGLELCGECAQLFINIIKDFNEYNVIESNIYKKDNEKVIVHKLDAHKHVA
jgi:hypothetical protein